ncbi:MAG: redoxin domain-containing protein [Deltaproteobacteria bacterium]|jgi:thiol-disulfide isomerase/thioredoxin
MNRSLRGALILAGAAWLVGCGDNVVGEPPAWYYAPRDAGQIDPDRDGGTPTYPVGPYGGEAGDVIENAAFAGYVTEMPVDSIRGNEYIESVTFEDLRDIEGYDYLLFNVAADWCAECKLEAREFPNQYAEWAPRGGLLVSVVIEDTNARPATKQVLDNWLRSQRPTYTTLHDPSAYVNRVLVPPTLPLNVVIDLETMTILRTQVGTDPAVFDYFESLLER